LEAKQITELLTVVIILEVDKSGDNFDTPLVLTTSTTTFANVNSEALNTAFD
jgi:hypothetical protein